MPRLIRSRAAEADLIEIATYISKDNPDAADKLIDQIVQKARFLAESPGLGRPRDDLAPGLRSFPVGKYLLFYVSKANGVQLVRVVHGARNLRRLFRNRRGLKR